LKPDQRIVTKLALTELCDERGNLFGERIRNLDLIGKLLQTGPVQFIVATCGTKLKWITLQERFAFWKRVPPHITDASKPIYLKQFPKEIAYIASEWYRSTGNV